MWACKRCGCEEFYQYGKEKRCKRCAKEWVKASRQKNPEAHRRAGAKWRAANPEVVRLNRKDWVEANRDRVRWIQYDWHKAHRDEVLAKRRAKAAEKRAALRAAKIPMMEAAE